MFETFHATRLDTVPRCRPPLAAAPLLRILLGLFVVFGAGSPARAAADKPRTDLVIASEGARPPYNFLDGNDLAGFEIDLGRELCVRMKKSCSFVVQDWDGLVPGLLEHRYDAIMAAMEITDEARARIAFSDPYVRMPAAFLASRETTAPDTSPGGLAGKKIGVETGSASQAYAEDFYPSSEIVTYSGLEEAILDLAESRLDVVLAGKDALVDFLQSRREGQCCRLVGDVPYRAAYFGNGIGIGLRPEDTALAAQFDHALASVRADGTYDRIRAKFFDYDVLPSEDPASTPPRAQK